MIKLREYFLIGIYRKFFFNLKGLFVLNLYFENNMLQLSQYLIQDFRALWLIRRLCTKYGYFKYLWLYVLQEPRKTRQYRRLKIFDFRPTEELLTKIQPVVKKKKKKSKKRRWFKSSYKKQKYKKNFFYRNKKKFFKPYYNRYRKPVLPVKKLTKTPLDLIGFKIFFKTLSKLTRDGKKRKAFSILLRSITRLKYKNQLKKPSINKLFYMLLIRLNPKFQFMRRNFGRRVVIVPRLILPNKRVQTIAKWIKFALSLKKTSKSSIIKLSEIISNAFNNKGELSKIKKHQTKLAIDNKFNAKPRFKKKMQFFKKKRR